MVKIVRRQPFSKEGVNTYNGFLDILGLIGRLLVWFLSGKLCS